VSAFIDAHRDRFGVEPICRVLTEHGVKIAPSTYYAAKSRPASTRSVRDTAVLAEIRRLHADRSEGRGLAGVRKVWHLLRREGGVDSGPGKQPVPRCQVERLMRSAGLQGVRRGKRFVTTRPDPGAVRAPDLLKREFSVERPNELWLVDFTYVPTWSGMAFTAFVADACRSVRSSTATFVAARWTGSGTTPEGTMSMFGNDILCIANGRFVESWTASSSGS